MDTTIIEGEYYLQGQREMASGFLLKPGGEFQFFFSYGALDRQGAGKWIREKDRLILDSTNKAGNDFTLIESRKAEDENISIKLDKPYPGLVRHVYCSIAEGVDGSWLPLNDQGEISFPPHKIRNISLLLEFCAERYSKTLVESAEYNQFTFRMEPSVMEVFFDNFVLQVENDSLAGRHPLLKGDGFSYTKK